MHYEIPDYSLERLALRRAAFKLQCVNIGTFSSLVLRKMRAAAT